jgi:hypothetical protein
MHASIRISVCRFTHSGPYVVHTEISKRSYNSEQRVYIAKKKTDLWAPEQRLCATSMGPRPLAVYTRLLYDAVAVGLL